MDLLVSDLIDHPLNDYFFDAMDGQKRAEFIESIRTSGIIEPLIVTQDNVIVSGHQRKAACLELGIENVPCVVRHYDDKDGISKEQWITKDLIDTNVQQRGAIGGSELKAIRRVDALRDIYKIKHGGARQGDDSKSVTYTLAQSQFRLEDVCAEAGVSKDNYKTYRCVSSLPEEFHDMLTSGDLPITLAAKIAKRLTADEQEQLFESLPVATRISSKIADPLIAEIEKLRSDNLFFQSDEDATSRRVDEVDLAARTIAEENERIKAGRGTDIEIELRRERDEARALSDSLENKNRIAESNLSRQKELRSIDSELGRTAEQQVLNLCNLVLATVEPLSSLPTSIFFKLNQATRNTLIDIIGQSVDGLSEIQSLLCRIAEAV